jgi:hypothetical protein
MSAIQRQVALVSESKSIALDEVLRVSAALQKQATRDLAPIWEVIATVDAFAKLEDVPLGYWPIMIRDNIGFNAAGIHLDKDGQPLALVTSGPDWSLTASHEALEMLVDPFGNRVVAGDSPKSDQGRVEFLVEVSDPSEAAEFGYTVNGILVSDFYTPQFFDPIQAPGVRYSFTGALTEPRQVLAGGYLSWHEPVSDHWFQLQFFGPTPTFPDLGPISAKNGSLRAQIDGLTEAKAAEHRKGTGASVQASLTARGINQQSSSSKATSWREQIETILGSGGTPPASAAEKPEVRRPRRMKGD